MNEKPKPKKPTLAPMPGVTCRNPECGEGVPAHLRHCVVCETDAGCPNVRAADNIREKHALAQRVREACDDAEARGCIEQLGKFQDAVMQSKAVIARSVAKISELVNNDNELYSTFYQQIDAKSRLPEDNEWDAGRESVDSLLFPHYHKEIRFASLSLNERGLPGYGGLTLVLKDGAIRDRATVFEKNTMVFCREHSVVAGSSVPIGFRAVWKDRADLAVAKLHTEITADTTDAHFPEILVPSSGERTSDFVEVHVYGELHRRAIAKVTGKEPKEKADKLLLRSVKTKLASLGVPVETVS